MGFVVGFVLRASNAKQRFLQANVGKLACSRISSPLCSDLGEEKP